METAAGPAPARLTPIFRDREELSAGTDLSEQVRAALAVSGALVVLCSPNARASQWVGKEIETFRTLHPGRPILAALIEGQPADAFPPALTVDGSEPVAADFRKGGDGARLGLLKLVAGMTGIGLDTLVQRDAQRQMRRVTAITLGALVAVLAMALVTLFAFRAQREAEAQRAQAEGLVEYMLTDLRDRLKGVGRLDVMTAVNERAMSYYGAQGDLSKLPPASLDRRARILHAMGEDDEKRGDLDKAFSKFTEAHRATAAVLTQKPDDPDAIFAHAQSEYWVGYAASIQDDRARALPAFIQYKILSDRLSKRAGAKREWLAESAYADGNLCTVYLDEPRNPRMALNYCQSALRKMEQVRDAGDHSREMELSLANRHAWLADALKYSGDNQRALAERKNQNVIVDRLKSRFPDDMEVLERWVVARMSLAKQMVGLASSDHIFIPLSQARKGAEQLVRHDPDNRQFMHWLDEIEAIQRGQGGTS